MSSSTQPQQQSTNPTRLRLTYKSNSHDIDGFRASFTEVAEEDLRRRNNIMVNYSCERSQRK